MATTTILPDVVDKNDLLELYTDPDTCPTDALIPRPLAEEPAFVAWQQDIPREYLAMEPEELDQRIRTARATLGDQLVILGHHYQRDEVIQYADFTGDSFKLAQLAAAQDRARYILFCGVHFMAESADILTPESVTVMLPNMAAGCSMADMADPDDVYAAWDEIHEALGDDASVVPITYMNSAASLKAFVGEHDGIVCTSSNAPKTFDYAFDRGEKILFFPDQHLGRNTAYSMGIPLEEMVLWNFRVPGGGVDPEALKRARVILWQGHCSTHQRFSVEQIEKAREEHPGLKVIVHPECRWEVVQAADDNGSTEKIIRTVTEAEPGTAWGVGTEINLVKRLAEANPDKTVFCLDPVVCPCSTMYRIHPAYLAWCLEGLVQGHVTNEIRVDAKTREWSLVALERMLALP
ncbi:MAG: quinolinate synthase NadA [Dehalococcoidia bacterium]|nr:quinolinate synthase NadA [Dehalococcoidia bacterium]MCA9843033.1 quinolinate synthase NadA [Dehalococcoidia bacterium]MCA9853476.1 quinolinate synthase NadA [Dehalococcoidia bacterium]